MRSKRIMAMTLAAAMTFTSILPMDGGFVKAASVHTDVQVADEMPEESTKPTMAPVPTATPGAYDKVDVAEALANGKLKIVSDSAVKATPVAETTAPTPVVTPEVVSGDGVASGEAVTAKPSKEEKVVEATSADAITAKQLKETTGVLLSATTTGLKVSTFEFTEEFDFDNGTPSYLMVNGLAEKDKKVTLDFYLDNEKKPFVSYDLREQKRKNRWTLNKSIVLEVDQKQKITGKHKVSFKVSTDAKKKVSFLLRAVMFMHTDLPMVSLDIDETKGTIEAMNGDSQHDTECYGDMNIEVPKGYQSEYTDNKFEGGSFKMEYIRGRGNSTWWAEKKPYKIKLDKKTDLFGMGKSKHWVLLANYYDVTMLRNKMTYYLGAKLGMEFTPQCVMVDVQMNGEYLGSYYLCEQVRVGESTVDIDDLEADEESQAITTGSAVTGGYLLSMFPYGDETELVIETAMGNKFLIESPSFEDYDNLAQYQYIADYVQNTENAIYGENFKDENGVSYSEYMDVDAAINYYWLQEVSMNGDGFGSTSTYLYKKRNDKLFWGPLWDFDYVAWGATEYYSNRVEGFVHDSSTWFARLLQDPEFCDKTAKRWQSIRKELLAIAADGGLLDQYGEQMKWSQKNNYAVWNKYSDIENGWWDYEAAEDQRMPVTYEGEVQRLKCWINERVDWVDNNISRLKIEPKMVTFVVDGKEYAVRQACVDRFGNSTLTLPEEPKKKGYVFVGWFADIEEEGETYQMQVMEDAYIPCNLVAVAKFVKESEIKKAKAIGISKTKMLLTPFDDGYLEVFGLPFDGYTGEVTWESSDEEVVTVNQSGHVEAKGKLGTAMVTAKTSTGLSVSCEVRVCTYQQIENNGDEYSWSPYYATMPSEMTIEVGETVQIPLEMYPEFCLYTDYGFMCSDMSVLDINAYGYMCGLEAGEAIVVLYGDCGIQFMKVTVKAKASKNVKNFKKNGLKYKVTKSKKTVSCTGFSGKSTASVTIPATVKYKGVTYKVTSVGAKAFQKNKKIKKVTLGKNITTIGSNTFYNCKNLKDLVIKSSKLTKVGSKAFKGVNKKMKLTAPKGKKKKYEKMISGK